MIVVSNWGRTKLIQYAHKFGIDQLCIKLADLMSKYLPLLRSINDTDDTLSINIHSTSPNKTNPRKKLHIKDPSEGEKLISSSNNDNVRSLVNFPSMQLLILTKHAINRNIHLLLISFTVFLVKLTSKCLSHSKILYLHGSIHCLLIMDVVIFLVDYLDVNSSKERS